MAPNPSNAKAKVKQFLAINPILMQTCYCGPHAAPDSLAFSGVQSFWLQVIHLLTCRCSNIQWGTPSTVGPKQIYSNVLCSWDSVGWEVARACSMPPPRMLNSKTAGLGSLEPLWTYKLTGAGGTYLLYPSQTMWPKGSWLTGAVTWCSHSPLEIVEEIHVRHRSGLIGADNSHGLSEGGALVGLQTGQVLGLVAWLRVA